MYIMNCHESHYVGVLDNPQKQSTDMQRRGVKSAPSASIDTSFVTEGSTDVK